MGWGTDIDFAVDFTVTGPTQINLATARVREGAMAEEAERRKLAEIAAHYTILDHERSRLVPFAMEVTGTMGKLRPRPSWMTRTTHAEDEPGAATPPLSTPRGRSSPPAGAASGGP